MTDYSTKAKVSTNYKSPFSGMDKYGTPRLELAMLLRDTVLKQLRIPWTLECGTLLGAWRSGEFILHDDDFDIAIYFETDPIPLLPGILKKIKQLLPPRYDARLVSSYADKIEVFAPHYGEYILAGPAYGGASFHHVTVDFQCYQHHDGDIYRSLYYINPQGFTVRKEDVFPIGRISLEGETFHAPNNVESFLKSVYGSISCNAKYNIVTGRYEDRDESDIIIGR